MKRTSHLVVTEVDTYGTALVKLSDGTDIPAVVVAVRGQWTHGQVQHLSLFFPLEIAETIRTAITETAPTAPTDLDDYHTAETAVNDATANVDTSIFNAAAPQLIAMLTTALGRMFPGRTATAGLAWARGDLADHLPYERRGILYRHTGDLLDSLSIQELRGLVSRAQATATAREQQP